MSSKFFILQSGFVTTDDSDSNTINPNSGIFKDYILNKGYIKTGNEYLYSVKVKDLFKEYLANHRILNDFDFRERILIEAFNSFKVKSMYLWFSSQNASPFLSDMHIEFLLDTINFIDGKPRKISISQWKNLLDTSVRHSDTDLNVDKYFSNDYSRSVDTEITEVGAIPSSIETFIERWVSKDNGFEDLLISLYVIFGDRSAVKLGS